jgi:hypothetical protein
MGVGNRRVEELLYVVFELLQFAGDHSFDDARKKPGPFYVCSGCFIGGRRFFAS